MKLFKHDIKISDNLINKIRSHSLQKDFLESTTDLIPNTLSKEEIYKYRIYNKFFYNFPKYIMSDMYDLEYEYYDGIITVYTCDKNKIKLVEKKLNDLEIRIYDLLTMYHSTDK